MEKPLYDEMLTTDCWNGEIVFSARGYRYDLLPNPVFGLYPDDCNKKEAAIFFTPLTVSLLVQTSVDDASIAVEDPLDTISAIVEHELPLSKSTASSQQQPTTLILEFRCLHSRFWFGNIETDDKAFDALSSVLALYSPGIAYDRFSPLSLEPAVNENQFAWTPPPPSEAPPSSRRTRSSRKTDTTTDGSPSQGSGRDDDDSSNSSDSDSSSSFGYSSVRGSGTRHKYMHSSAASHRLYADDDDDVFSPHRGAGGGSRALQMIALLEAEGRCEILAEALSEFVGAAKAMERDCEKVMAAHVAAVRQINTSTLDSKHGFTDDDNNPVAVPQRLLEEPASDAVRSFLEDLEKSVRVRMNQYLVSGAGPAVLAQRQQAEAASLYRSLSDQLDRLKSQNSALAIHLAQERRHIEEVEQELEQARADVAQAKAREAAVVSRMRKREADWAASGRPTTTLGVDMDSSQ